MTLFEHLSPMIAKHGSKPSRRQCEQAARVLILQYPFLKDDLGPGYMLLPLQLGPCINKYKYLHLHVH